MGFGPTFEVERFRVEKFKADRFEPPRMTAEDWLEINSIVDEIYEKFWPTVKKESEEEL